MAIVTPAPQPQGQAPVSAAPKQADTLEAPIDATPSEVTTPKPAEDPLSPKFAALARQQRMVRQQQRDFEAQRQAFEAERKELEQLRSWKTTAAQDPYKAMLDLGLTAEQAAAKMLNQPSAEDQAMYKLQQEIQALKQDQEKTVNKFNETQQQQREIAIKQIRNDVANLIKTDETYDTIKSLNAEEAVTELIVQTYDAEGIRMTIEEASQQVEDYLVEEALKMSQLKKIQARNAPPQAQPGTQQPLPPIQKPQMTTLSNRIEQSARPMSSKERRERAIAAFQGKLQ